MSVRIISLTPDAEAHILYCARVSSNQENTDTGLIKYLIRNHHWSPFEMANAVFEIETSRAIAQQILRHRSFSFQEFSLRYAEAVEFETYKARRQATSNRQSSIDDLNSGDILWFADAQREVQDFCRAKYFDALDLGVAKEQARFLLPLSTSTKLYMNGTIRSWIHYCAERTSPHAQEEHRMIALDIRNTLFGTFQVPGECVLPIIGEALNDYWA